MYSFVSLLLVIISLANGFPLAKRELKNYIEIDQLKHALKESSSIQSEGSLIVVKNTEEIGQKYSHLMDSSNNDQYVFRVEETNSYITRSFGIGSNDNNFFDSSHIDAQLINSKHKYKKIKNLWVEFGYDQPEEEEYPGYIPISACQSQEYGKSGKVSFSYSFTKQGSLQNTFATSLGIPAQRVTFTLGNTLGLSKVISKSFTGQVDCPINQGYIGQVFLRPTYATCTPKGRAVKWDKTKKKLFTDSSFKKYDKIHVLLEGDTYQIDCATNDVVDLFCEEELGQANWTHPLGLGYSKISTPITQ